MTQVPRRESQKPTLNSFMLAEQEDELKKEQEMQKIQAKLLAKRRSIKQQYKVSELNQEQDKGLYKA